MRAQVNRIVVALALAVALPVVAICARVKPRAGRRVATRAVRLVARACGVRFEVEGTFAAEGSYVVVANHGSPLDIAALLVAVPDGRFLAAKGLFRVPLLGSALRGLDAVPIDRHDPAAAYARLDALAREGRCLRVIAFPQGGFHGVGAPFKRGAFVLAAAVGAPVVPVAISGAEAALPPHAALAVRPGWVRVRVLDPITPSGPDPAEDLRARAEASVLSATG